MPDLYEYALEGGVRLFVAPTAAFRRVVIHGYLRLPLDRQTVAPIALVSGALTLGTERWPDAESMAARLADLYGARLQATVSRKGEEQVLLVSLELVNPRDVNDPHLLREAAETLKQVMLRPLPLVRGWQGTEFDHQLEALRRRILARADDKVALAIRRCEEIMCQDERYSISELGTIEDLRGVTPEAVIRTYEEALARGALEVWVTGDVAPEAVHAALAPAFAEHRTLGLVPDPAELRALPGPLRRVEEPEPISQTVLILGYRTGIGLAHPLWYNLAAACHVWGAGTHSKSFRSLREETGLVYEQWAMPNALKGTAIVWISLDYADLERVMDQVAQDLQAVQRGEISDWEMRATLETMRGTLFALDANPHQRVDALVNSRIARRPSTVPERIAAIEREVIPARVAEAARSIRLDTVYVMRGEEVTAG